MADNQNLFFVFNLKSFNIIIFKHWFIQHVIHRVVTAFPSTEWAPLLKEKRARIVTRLKWRYSLPDHITSPVPTTGKRNQETKVNKGGERKKKKRGEGQGGIVGGLWPDGLIFISLFYTVARHKDVRMVKMVRGSFLSSSSLPFFGSKNEHSPS